MNSRRFLILALCLLAVPLFGAPPPIQRNEFTTNAPGTIVTPTVQFQTVRTYGLFYGTNSLLSTPQMYDLAEDYSGTLRFIHIAPDGVVFTSTNYPAFWPPPLSSLLPVVTNEFTVNPTGTVVFPAVQFNQVTSSNAFRSSTNPFAPTEFVTENHVQDLLAGLAGNTFYFSTNQHAMGSNSTLVAGVPSDQYLTNLLASGTNDIRWFFSTNVFQSAILPAGAYQAHLHAFKTTGGPEVSIGMHLGYHYNNTNFEVGVSDLATVDVQEGSLSVRFILATNVTLPSTNAYFGVHVHAVKSGGGVTLVTHYGGNTLATVTTPNLLGLSTIPNTLTLDRVNLNLQSQLYATNYVLDFATPQFNEITLTNNINFYSTNRAAGKSYSLRVNAGGESAWTLSFPSWHFLGGVAPTTIAQGRVAKLVIECYGTSETNIVAGWAVEP